MFGKKIIISAVLAVMSLSAFAGGYVTNTSMSVKYLRNPAQQALISIHGAYYNPAGLVFLDNGFHGSFGWEVVHQTRHPEANYGPLALGKENGGSPIKTFKGTTNVPFLPSLFLVYKKDRWAASFVFQIIGGGGKCDFENGLSSFESKIATLPYLINGLGKGMGLPVNIKGYDVDTYVRGSQLYHSGQFNFSYRITKRLSASIGARLIFAQAENIGHIRDFQLSGDGTNYVPAGDYFTGMAAQLQPVLAANPQLAQSLTPILGAAQGLAGNKELNVKQKDFAVSPMVSIDYKGDKFNLSARYEFRTSIKMKNDTKENTTGVAKYDDGVIITGDLPAQLALGADINLFPKLRLDLQYNYYFDKQSKQYEDRQKLIEDNTMEFLGGLEWDFAKKWTVSAGAQYTRFGYGDNCEYFNDTAFNPCSVSVGFGFRFKATDRLGIDLGVFKTFYQHCTQTREDYPEMLGMLKGMAGANPAIGQMLSGLNLSGSDRFYRKSFVVGLGIDYKF